jgi:hypothetical protein
MEPIKKHVINQFKTWGGLRQINIYVMIDVRYWEITTSFLSVIILTSYKTQGHQESRVWESQTEPVMYTHLYCLCSLWFLWNKALCFTVATC